jgi:hypothetical protein
MASAATRRSSSSSTILAREELIQILEEALALTRSSIEDDGEQDSRRQ